MGKDDFHCFHARSFLSLFSLSACTGCPYQEEDRKTVLGACTLYAFHVDPVCLREVIPTEEMFIRSPKVKLFLKEMLLEPERVYLVLEDWEDEETLEDLELLGGFGLDLMILSR